MHSIGAYIQDKSVAVAVRVQNGGRALLATAARGMRAHGRRLAGETGQTAVEYAGILVLVAVLVGALFKLHLDTKLKTIASDAMDQIGGHCKHKC